MKTIDLDGRIAYLVEGEFGGQWEVIVDNANRWDSTENEGNQTKTTKFSSEEKRKR